MANYCSYKGCPNVHRSFTSKTFFNLPTDSRREVWINNSGNEKLKDINPNVRRIFCEDHFNPKYFRRQFNRTLLRREAIPYPYIDVSESEEFEYFEMAESEEETEPNCTENDKLAVTEVIILPNKSNIESHQAKFKQIDFKSYTKTPKIDVKMLKCHQSTPADEKKDIEVDFIVVEESIDAPLKNEVIKSEPGSSKKMRFQIESTTNNVNESDSPKEAEEIITIHPKAVAQATPSSILLKNTAIDGIVSSSETVDCNKEETYFALSLVGILKRLPPHKRAIAKCHILSYLTELEYGSSSLP